MKRLTDKINLADLQSDSAEVKYCCAKNLIAIAKPQYQKQITEELLKVEHYEYDTDECRNIAMGKVIEAIGSYCSQLKDRKAVIEFAQRQTKNTRNATRKKAERFLKKTNKDRDMPVVAVIGGQWGDEGKGKVVDHLAEKAKVVVRFSGGNNAGHTVINQLGEFRMHLIPSGIFYPGVTCLIANGVVIDPAALLGELETLKKSGISVSNLFISDRAHVIMPYHILLDGLEEKSRGKGAIGTTLKGIGPAFVDKIARMGIRICDLLDKDNFKNRLSSVLEYKNNILVKLYGAAPLALDEVYQKYVKYGEQLAPFVRETDVIMREAVKKGEMVLLEGAQGSMLDLDFGTYPYVTSAAMGGASLSMGLGIGSRKIDGVIAVFKAYTTRVGGGAFPTELHDECGNQIRERAHEYGTTTGRPRRCGWFDGVVARFSSEVNGLTSAAITRFDILDIFPTIKVCTAYKIGNTTYHRPPANQSLFEKCQPIYEELPGWQTPTSDIRSFKKLPSQAQAYVKKLEELIGCPISLVSVGPAREQTIMVRPIL